MHDLRLEHTANRPVQLPSPLWLKPDYQLKTDAPITLGAGFAIHFSYQDWQDRQVCPWALWKGPNGPDTYLMILLQVFDSGLIGEGVLHSVAWAKARLLQPDAVLVGPRCPS